MSTERIIAAWIAGRHENWPGPPPAPDDHAYWLGRDGLGSEAWRADCQAHVAGEQAATAERRAALARGHTAWATAVRAVLAREAQLDASADDYVRSTLAAIFEWGILLVRAQEADLAALPGEADRGDA